jgi:hypothetical protein
MSAIITAHSLKLAIALFAIQSGPQTIQRPLRAGDSDRYNMKMVMDQKMNMGASGSQTITSKMEAEYLLKITKLNASSRTAQAEMTVTTTKAEMDGMMGHQTVPATKPIHESGLLDSRNRFQPSHADNSVVSSFMGMGGGGASQSAGLMIELPDHPVKTGDSWSMDIAGMSQMGMGDHRLTVTLLGPGQMNGHAVWKVKVTGHLPVSVDMNKMLGAASSSSGQGAASLSALLGSMSMTMAGSMDYAGTGVVDQKTGKTAKLDYSVASDLTMHMSPKQGGAAAPMTIKVAGSTTCTLRLAGY